MPRKKQPRQVEILQNTGEVFDDQNLTVDRFVDYLDKFDTSMSEAHSKLRSALQVIAALQDLVDRKIETVFDSFDEDVALMFVSRLNKTHHHQLFAQQTGQTATHQSGPAPKYATPSERRKAANKRRWARQWISIVERDGDACGLCGGANPEDFDHVVPKSKGGQDSIANKILTHRYCNGIKADNDYLLMKEQLTQMRSDTERKGRTWPPTKLDMAKDILDIL